MPNSYDTEVNFLYKVNSFIKFIKQFLIFDVMRLFKIIFWVLWRVWFYVVMGIPIIIMFPLLFISILKETWYPYFFRIARIWAKIILFGMGFYYKIEKEQDVESGKKLHVDCQSHIDD
ncbi:acyltransferase [Flavobacterium psychrophilum]|nr:acyltransferase [Flavobacterium psychrophilum]